MKKIILLILVLISSIYIVYAIPNPAAVYCKEMGYDYVINHTVEGEQGICVVEDNEFNAWEFFQGKVGKEYSYCARQGYDIKTAKGGKYSDEHAVCFENETRFQVSEEMPFQNKTKIGIGEEASLADMMGLREKLTSGSLEEENISEPPLKQPVVTLASSFDWTNRNGWNWMTSVKDQGSCGSCWAFAAVAGIEAQYNIERNNPSYDLDLSEQYLVSSCCTNCGDCCGGSASRALSHIKSNGIVDEACFPYVDKSGCTCDKNTCDSNCKYDATDICSDATCSDKCSNWNSRIREIRNYHSVSKNVQGIQNGLQHGPVVVAMKWGGGFSGGIYRCDESSQKYKDAYGHAVLIVGYDDNGQYWKVKNSWGSGWHDNGYFKAGYDECEIQTRRTPYYIAIRPVTTIKEKVDRIYQYTGSYSGSLSDTYYDDSSYMTLTEKCGALSTCDGLEAHYYFFFPYGFDYSGVDSVKITTIQDATENGFDLYYWDYTDTDDWKKYYDVPSSWRTLQFTACNNALDCAAHTSAMRTDINYYHGSCGLCDTDHVYVDFLEVEIAKPCPCLTGDCCDGCNYRSSSSRCNLTYKCSSGAGNNRYGTGGNYRCQGYCDGNGDCDYAGNCVNCDASDRCYTGTYRDYYCSGGLCRYNTVITDNDGDSYDIECEHDCDDNNASIYPGAVEFCRNNADDDCNGLIDEEGCLPPFSELVQRVITLENQNWSLRLLNLEEWKIIIQNTVDAIEIQLETVKQWLFFWNWQGVDENVCDALMDECQEVCIYECNGGEIGCEDEDTRWYCERHGCCYYKIYEDCDIGEICEDGVCCSVECYDDLDCPSDDVEYYCDNNDVYERITTYECMDAGICASYCDDDIDEGLFDDCDDDTEICIEGNSECGPCAIECDTDLDCGTNTTEYYCDNNDVYERTIGYECIDGGTCDSYCDENVIGEAFFEDCDIGKRCEDGECVLECDPCSPNGAWKICGQSGCYGTTVCLRGCWTRCSSKGLSCGDGKQCNLIGQCV